MAKRRFKFNSWSLPEDHPTKCKPIPAKVVLKGQEVDLFIKDVPANTVQDADIIASVKVEKLNPVVQTFNADKDSDKCDIGMCFSKSRCLYNCSEYM